MSDAIAGQDGAWAVLPVHVEGPFSLPLLLAGVRRRANESVDLVVDDTYRRLIVHDGRPLLLLAREVANAPRAVLLGVWTPGGTPDAAALAAAHTAFARIASLEANPLPFYDRMHDDPVFGPLIRARRGLRPQGAPTIFEMLVVAILGQQISLIAAGSIKRKMVHALSTQATIEDRTYYAFPSAEALADATHEQLVALSFSRRKAEYVRDLARQVADGALDLEGLRGQPHTVILERLVALRGIGHWTAEYLLLRGYGYADALPAGDAALRRQIARLYELPVPPNEREIIALGEAWRPFRSWATLYLWNAEPAAY